MSDRTARDVAEVADYYDFLGSTWLYDLSVETLLPIDGSIREDLLSQGTYPDGCRILDAATGSGRNIRHLLDLTDDRSNILGIDVSMGMLNIAQSRIGDNYRVELKQMPIENISPDEKFDVITASYLLSVAPYPRLAVSRMLDTLKPTGEILILAVQFPDNLSWAFQRLLSFEEWIAKADLSRNPESIIDDAGGDSQKVLTRWEYIHGYRVTH